MHKTTVFIIFKLFIIYEIKPNVPFTSIKWRQIPLEIKKHGIDSTNNNEPEKMFCRTFSTKPSNKPKLYFKIKIEKKCKLKF